MGNMSTFVALVKYAKGEITGNELIDSDELFYKLREQSLKGESELTVIFPDEERFMESLGLSTDDISTYHTINSPYHDYEPYDYYTAMEDFDSGYLFRDFNDENTEKLNLISRLIFGRKINFDDTNQLESLTKKLGDLFKKEKDSIVSEYHTVRNNEIIESASERINKEFAEHLKEFRFEPYGDDGFKTTVGNLLALYMKNGKYLHLNLEDFLNSVNDDTHYFGWQDYFWEVYNPENFDSEAFNKTVSYSLDNIIEKLEDSSDIDDTSITKCIELMNRIEKKFNMDELYFLPKDTTRKVKFKIKEIECPTMKISVVLTNGEALRTIKVTEENFYNLLYQPSLFDLNEII